MRLAVCGARSDARGIPDQSARDHDTFQAKIGLKTLPRRPEDYLPHLDPLEVCAFERDDALELVRWTAQTWPSQEAYGRYKLLQAIDAAQAPYQWALTDLEMLEDTKDAFAPIRARARALVADDGSNSQRKMVQRAEPIYQQAAVAAGLLPSTAGARWDEVKQAAHRAASGRPLSKNLQDKMKSAPTTADWLLIGMAARRGWLIVTTERKREFKMVDFKRTPEQVLSMLEAEE